MKANTYAPLAIVLFAMSGCLKPGPSGQSISRTQSAGPQTLARPDTAQRPFIACTTEAGRTNLSEIGDAAESLFQSLKNDIDDQVTIHERAGRLADLEREYAAHFVSDCAESGITEVAVTARIEKLDLLAKETDGAIVRQLAEELWALFYSPGVPGDENYENPFSDENP